MPRDIVAEIECLHNLTPTGNHFCLTLIDGAGVKTVLEVPCIGDALIAIAGQYGYDLNELAEWYK